MEFLNSFADQRWFQIAAEITLFMSALASVLPAKWKIKSDGTPRSWYKYIYAVVEFLAYNFFNAKSIDPTEPKE